MRALVTGFVGFTGQYVAAEMERAGWEVWGMDALELPNAPRYRKVDLCDEDVLAQVVAEIQPDAVIHLAGIAFVGHGAANDFYRINLIGTRNLLEAVATKAGDVKCVLLASSANVYGNATEGVLNEDTLPNPANDYGVSKLAMEYMARLWMDKLPIVITRPFNYTGVGQSESFLLPKIVAHFRRQADVIELGNLDVWRDFSDVRAVAQVYRRLVESCPAGQAVNVCSGKAYSLREVLAMCEEIAGHRIEVRVNPAFVRDHEVKTLCGDASRLHSLIGDLESPPLLDTFRWMLTADR